MRTIITGGCGFIGSALAQYIQKKMESSDELILIDSMKRHGKIIDSEITKDPRIKIECIDLTDKNSLNSLSFTVDRLYHLAAIVGVGIVEADPLKVLLHNTVSTINIFEWFCNHKKNENSRLLFSSSSETYSGAYIKGFDIKIPTPENVPLVISDINNPRFSYALSKIWGEAYSKYLSKNNIFTTSVRYHNIYGPKMGYDHVIPQVILRIKSREKPFKIIGADQTRSFCWIEDAVKATYMVMESDQLTPGSCLHIGNQQEEVSIGSLYDTLFKICKWQPEEIVNLDSTKGSVSRRCPDTDFLKKITGYTPSTPIAKGLEITTDWYMHNS
ncbi:nucleoside-diphosphate-sugar epimerase [Candidatus Magnetomorum sp. HK-1]|nr:nucleoside-diphosphate-sugar epimerase [Candidatus Magnetomorum sp. HK-1]